MKAKNLYPVYLPDISLMAQLGLFLPKTSKPNFDLPIFKNGTPGFGERFGQGKMIGSKALTWQMPT